MAALDEIGFWLERERASTYKVQAFRRAAAALGDRDADHDAAKEQHLDRRRERTHERPRGEQGGRHHDDIAPPDPIRH